MKFISWEKKQQHEYLSIKIICLTIFLRVNRFLSQLNHRCIYNKDLSRIPMKYSKHEFPLTFYELVYLISEFFLHIRRSIIKTKFSQNLSLVNVH